MARDHGAFRTLGKQVGRDETAFRNLGRARRRPSGLATRLLDMAGHRSS
jgi:hypothetical protein